MFSVQIVAITYFLYFLMGIYVMTHSVRPDDGWFDLFFTMQFCYCPTPYKKDKRLIFAVKYIPHEV